MAFDPEVALAYARALARPRLVGSGEEQTVASEIVARLEGLGYRVEREPFKFTRAFDIALASEIALALALVLLALFIPPGAIVVGCALLGLLAIAPLLNRAVQYHAVAPQADAGMAASPLTAICLRLGRLYRAANIVATPAPAGEANRQPHLPHLYLVSHLDSKSQRLSIPIRILLYVVFVPSVALFAVSTFVGLLSPGLQWIGIIFGCLSLVSGLPLALLDVQNESPGAIDNASGTGLVLHLAGVLLSRPDVLSKIHLTLLITSAEEMATLGALYHVQRRASALRGEKLYVLNFDGIGVDGKLYRAGRGVRRSMLRSRALREAQRPGPAGSAQGSVEDSLVHLLHRACAELKIPLARFSLTGVLFDHVPFAQHGLDSATLLTIGKASRYVHTAADSADKLHRRGFEMAGRVALKVIEHLATPTLSLPHREMCDGGG